MEEETTVIKTELIKLEDMDLSVIVGSKELTIQVQIQSLAKHGKTMLMMYEATKEHKYLQQARLDHYQAKCLKDIGFVRPLGCYLAA